MTTRRTPSLPVQTPVGGCLTPLVRAGLIGMSVGSLHRLWTMLPTARADSPRATRSATARCRRSFIACLRDDYDLFAGNR